MKDTAEISMRIPLLDLKKQHDPIRREIDEAISEVADGNEFILGAAVTKFEERIARYCGVKHAIGVSSGTDALLASLMALGIGPGDEVITPVFSFFATAGVVSRLNAKPVFTDIEPATFNMDPNGVERLITKNTKAIIIVHLYGQCADMSSIKTVADKHGIPIIEDAAQSIGAAHPEFGRACSIGALGCLSFFPTKNLGAWGDAGMVLTNDDSLAHRLRISRVHGAQPKYYHKFIGGNFRIDAIQAAVLNVKLNYLDDWTGSRSKNADTYRELFLRCGLDSMKGFLLPQSVYASSDASFAHIYNQFVLRTPKRDELRSHLSARGISSEIYYPLPFHLQECFAHLGYRKGDFPQAEIASNSVLALPIYPELGRKELSYIVEKIAEFYKG